MRFEAPLTKDFKSLLRRIGLRLPDEIKADEIRADELKTGEDGAGDSE